MKRSVEHAENPTLTGQTYVPGQCNLGSRDISKRRRVGYIGFSLSIVFILLSKLLALPHAFAWLLFFPLAYGFTGYFQARQHFCVVYGVMGVARSSDEETFTRIKDRNSRIRDLRMVSILIFKSTLAAGLLTALYILLLHYLS